MFVVADTDALVADGIIRVDAAEEMKRRGRGVMVTLAINMVLCFGIQLGIIQLYHNPSFKVCLRLKNCNTNRSERG